MISRVHWLGFAEGKGRRPCQEYALRQDVRRRSVGPRYESQNNLKVRPVSHVCLVCSRSTTVEDFSHIPGSNPIDFTQAAGSSPARVIQLGAHADTPRGSLAQLVEREIPIRFALLHGEMTAGA